MSKFVAKKSNLGPPYGGVIGWNGRVRSWVERQGRGGGEGWGRVRIWPLSYPHMRRVKPTRCIWKITDINQPSPVLLLSPSFYDAEKITPSLVMSNAWIVEWFNFKPPNQCLIFVLGGDIFVAIREFYSLWRPTLNLILRYCTIPVRMARSPAKSRDSIPLRLVTRSLAKSRDSIPLKLVARSPAKSRDTITFRLVTRSLAKSRDTIPLLLVARSQN